MYYFPDVHNLGETTDLFKGQSPPSILFIDDDLNILQSLSTVLESFGYGVNRQHRSERAIELIKQQEFDLVLTDLKISDQSGIEILKSVKACQPRTPVIILTGYATLVSAIEALHEGAYGYLMKPCNIKEMKMTVERGIKQKRLFLERDRYLAEVQQKNSELEHTMRQLKDANNQLKNNENFRETIVSMFTHDLFNPVTTIKGFVNILQRDGEAKLSPVHSQYFNVIKRNIKKIEILINTFQTFYKIDNQTYDITPQRMDLNQSLRDSLKGMEMFAQEQEITISTSVPDNPVFIDGDPFELERAITNVLFNAIKYSPPNSEVMGSLELLEADKLPPGVSLREADEYAVVSVKDTGIGIGQEDLEHIFEKLYRAENARQTKGTGIGLYITKFIIDLHEGAISVSSEVTKGSVFSIYLPLSAD